MQADMVSALNASRLGKQAGMVSALAVLAFSSCFEVSPGSDMSPSSPVPPPSVEMRCVGEWRAVSVDKEDRKALSELTDIAVVKAAGKPQVPYRPKYVLTLSVGRPPQQIEVAVDTSSGSTWLLELGAQSFHGELQDVAFYRALESRTARFIEAAELSPRVHVALGPLAARGVDVVGRIIADDVQLADLRIPSQPLIIGEKAPESVKSWHLGGSLGLGLRSDASAPLVDAWRSAWMEPPDQGNASNPTDAAIQSQPLPKGGARGHHMPRPIISIWPQLKPITASPSEQVQATRPWIGLRLGLGSLQGVAWSSLLNDAAGWATDGYVSVATPPEKVTVATWQRATSLSSRWPGRLLVDTASPFLGVPARRFASFVLSLIPPHMIQYCWWSSSPASGLQVQCDCSAVVETRQVAVEVANIILPLGARELWQNDARGEVCTALLKALQEPIETWRLGEPFLRRHAVTLDMPRSRLGFSPPPLSGLGMTMKEDISAPSFSLRFPEDGSPFSQLIMMMFSTVGTSSFVPALTLAILAMLVIVSFLRSAGHREHRRHNMRVPWRPTATPSVGSDEECIALCRDVGEFDEPGE
jgi:hypothetical protein